MSKELEMEFQALIDIAWAEFDKAMERGDEKTAEFFMNEALELVAKLPENKIVLKVAQ